MIAFCRQEPRGPRVLRSVSGKLGFPQEHGSRKHRFPSGRKVPSPRRQLAGRRETEHPRGITGGVQFSLGFLTGSPTLSGLLKDSGNQTQRDTDILHRCASAVPGLPVASRGRQAPSTPERPGTGPRELEHHAPLPAPSSPSATELTSAWKSSFRPPQDRPRHGLHGRPGGARWGQVGRL